MRVTAGEGFFWHLTTYSSSLVRISPSTASRSTCSGKCAHHQPSPGPGVPLFCVLYVQMITWTWKGILEISGDVFRVSWSNNSKLTVIMPFSFAYFRQWKEIQRQYRVKKMTPWIYRCTWVRFNECNVWLAEQRGVSACIWGEYVGEWNTRVVVPLMLPLRWCVRGVLLLLLLLMLSVGECYCVHNWLNSHKTLTFFPIIFSLRE